MPSRRSREAGLRAAVEVSEILLSSEYRTALDAAFEQDPERHTDQRLGAEAVIYAGYSIPGNTEERVWETRRLAALTEARGTDLGPFNDYIQDQGGHSRASELTALDLAPGAPGVVRTNSQIVSLDRVQDEPIDFLRDALAVIDDNRTLGKDHVGPENYATSIKFFADKVEAFPSTHLDGNLMKELVDRTLEGFLTATEEDLPNFIEMTNVYTAVRKLPAGSVDGDYTRPLIVHSLDQLPTYNDGILSVARAAIGKLDLSENREEAATLVDLSLRKGRPLETTRDMRQALRSVAHLMPGAASNRTFKTFMDNRNNLEEPLDMEGVEEVNERLVYVVQYVTDDPALTLEAQELARTNTVRAIELYNEQRRRDELTPTQLQQLKATVKRVGDYYQQI